MSKETKLLQIHQSEVNDTIEKMGWFGWELLGAPQQDWNGFSVTFQRDRSLPCYGKLCELESKYDTAKFEMDKCNSDLMGLSGYSVSESERGRTMSLRDQYSKQVIDCMTRAQSIQKNGGCDEPVGNQGNNEAAHWGSMYAKFFNLKT